MNGGSLEEEEHVRTFIDSTLSTVIATERVRGQLIVLVSSSGRIITDACLPPTEWLGSCISIPSVSVGDLDKQNQSSRGVG